MLQRISQIITIIAAVIAVLTFIVSVVNQISQQEKKDIDLWREVVVYDIVRKAGSEGVKFEEIKAKYSTEVTFYPKEIPKSELNVNVLKKILLMLISSGVLEATDSQTYRLTIAPKALHGMYQMENLNFQLVDHLNNTLFSNPNHYTIESLTNYLSTKFKDIPIPGIRAVITMGVDSHAIMVDPNGKLSLR